MFLPRVDIGLDLGSSQITIIKARKTARGVEIFKSGSRATPASAVAAGQIQNISSLGDALFDLVVELGLKKQKVIAAVSAPNVYTRIITMPRMKKRDLRQAIKYKALSFLPVPVEEVIIDFFPLREYSDLEGEKIEILFAAVRRQQVERLQEVCGLSGLKLQVVDMEELALNRLLKKEKTQNRAFLFLDAWRSNFWVVKKGIMPYQRHIYQGYRGSRPGIDLKADYPGLNIAKAGENTDGINDNIAREVALALEHCSTRSKIAITQISVLGRGASVPGLVEAIADECNCRVEEADILPLINKERKQLTKSEIIYDYSVALGLAIRGG